MPHARNSIHGGHHSDHDSNSRRHPGDRSLQPSMRRYSLLLQWVVSQAPRMVLLLLWVLVALVSEMVLALNRMRRPLARSLRRLLVQWQMCRLRLCVFAQQWARPWGRPFDPQDLRPLQRHFISPCDQGCPEPMGGFPHTTFRGNQECHWQELGRCPSRSAGHEMRPFGRCSWHIHLL